jgi:hypothetical protein
MDMPLTKARPAKKPVRETAIPDAKEVKALIAALPPMEAAAALKAIEAAALPLRSPFAAPEGYKAANWTDTLEKRIAAKTKELHQAGKLKAAYSMP